MALQGEAGILPSHMLAYEGLVLPSLWQQQCMLLSKLEMTLDGLRSWIG